MININSVEKEKIYDNIARIKEEIWETREYISSDYCKKCSEMYNKLFRLEQVLDGLKRKLSHDNSQD
jgi:hypothetical protein